MNSKSKISTVLINESALIFVHNIVIQLNQTWYNNAWSNNSKDSSIFNMNWKLLTGVEELWQGGAWMYHDKFTCTYDTNGNTLTDLCENWQSGSWVNFWIYTYTYDINGNMLTNTNANWQSNSWLNSWRYSYTYDMNGNMLTNLLEAWQSNAWVNNERYTYSYDVNGNSISGKYEQWQNGNWQPGQGNLYLYSNRVDVYSFSGVYRYEASFVSFITGIVNMQADNNDFAVYPNPASDRVFINYNERQDIKIQIYNVIGGCLQQRELCSGTNEIDISSLMKGIYVIKLTGANWTGQKKLIKE